jgi:hypothetical protein
MSNGTTVDPQKNHVRFIVACITILGICCISGGVVLIYKGYPGDLLIGGGLAAISGLAGFLGAGRPNTPQPDITVSGQPPKLEVTQPKKEEQQPETP